MGKSAKKVYFLEILDCHPATATQKFVTHDYLGTNPKSALRDNLRQAQVVNLLKRLHREHSGSSDLESVKGSGMPPVYHDCFIVEVSEKSAKRWEWEGEKIWRHVGS